MAPLAPTDIARGWRTLTAEQQDDAATLIAAALAWMRDPGRRPDITDEDPIARRVVIEVVRTALAAPAEFAGHTSYSKTVGPWSKSGTVATPAGTLAFSEAHASMLGISLTGRAVGEFGDPLGYRYPPPEPVMP